MVKDDNEYTIIDDEPTPQVQRVSDKFDKHDVTDDFISGILDMLDRMTSKEGMGFGIKVGEFEDGTKVARLSITDIPTSLYVELDKEMLEELISSLSTLLEDWDKIDENYKPRRRGKKNE